MNTELNILHEMHCAEAKMEMLEILDQAEYSGDDYANGFRDGFYKALKFYSVKQEAWHKIVNAQYNPLYRYQLGL